MNARDLELAKDTQFRKSLENMHLALIEIGVKKRAKKEIKKSKTGG